MSGLACELLYLDGWVGLCAGGVLNKKMTDDTREFKKLTLVILYEG